MFKDLSVHCGRASGAQSERSKAPAWVSTFEIRPRSKRFLEGLAPDRQELR